MSEFLNTTIFGLLIPIIVMLVISFICAMLKEKGTFSMDTFLVCLSICIPVLIWKNVFPLYTISLSVIIIVGILFSTNKSGTNGGI